MTKLILILALWLSLLCASISGALTLGLLADRYLTNRAYDRTEWMVKDNDPQQTPDTGTVYYQHQQNEKRKEGIGAILRIAVPTFIISGLASLALFVAVVKPNKEVPNQ